MPRACYKCVYGDVYSNAKGPYVYCDLDIGDNIDIDNAITEAEKCGYYIEDGIDTLQEWKERHESHTLTNEESVNGTLNSV